ncbi:M4 family metallopeptidase [Thiotrichales bacterium 19S11-10]|nr:M4 family metallopeptidase [Thiotrichales bacterium 19S11-10]
MKSYKKIVILSIAAITSSVSFATNQLMLDNQPLSRLGEFSFQPNQLSLTGTNKTKNELKLVRSSQVEGKLYQRFQQVYQGIEVIGQSVVIESDQTNMGILSSNATATGQLIEDLEININPQLQANAAFDIAMNLFNKAYAGYQVDKEGQLAVSLKIMTQNKKPRLIYLVKIKGNKSSNKPVAMHYYIDANTGVLVTAWDNIQTFGDSGPGGNEKVGKYYYGEKGMPTLDVEANGTTCTMNNERVKAINLNQTTKNISDAFSYACGYDRGDAVNGSYSALDDAFYFGDVIIDMYSDWYKTTALKNTDGSPMQLVMRVHYDYNYENAFWNGENMTFGDGNPNGDFYPLVSLDVAAHEVSHGFTEQHSELVYRDESGSLNEAYSDMAGQATRAYLLSKDASNYQVFYPEDPANQIGWGLGETITRGEGQSLRYMNQPSDDGASADCYDYDLAMQSGGICRITYNDVVETAEDYYPWPWQAGNRQGYIVHTGSGVFNKAFYLITTKWYEDKAAAGDANAYVNAVEEAFRVMVVANAKYWNSSTGFTVAACGVKRSARDLGYSVSDITDAFNQVGVSTDGCKL